MLKKGTMRVFHILIIVFVIELFFNCNNAIGSDWKFYADTSDTKFYYNADSVRNVSESIFQVWVKEVHMNEKGKKEIIETRKELGLSTEGFEDLQYTLELWRLNCADKTHKFLSFVYFNNTGSILDSYHSEPGTWSVIVPHSAGEKLYKALCAHKQDINRT